MNLRNLRFLILPFALGLVGYGATAAQIESSNSENSMPAAYSDGFHDFGGSVDKLRAFLESRKSSATTAGFKLAANEESADDLLAKEDDDGLLEEAEEAPKADAGAESDKDADTLLSEESEKDPDSLVESEAASSDDDLLGGDSSESSDSLLAEESTDDGDGLLSGDDEGGLQASEDSDDLLSNDDDDLLLSSDDDDDANETAENLKKEEQRTKELAKAAAADHEKLFLEARYPSANTCATCHPKQYEEWSVSQHAYAQLSPIYMAMQTTINMKTSQTNGDFCIRCHNPVGMNLGESIFISNLERAPTSREGITCVACHRVNKNYGKISGRFSLVEGDVFSQVFGPTGGEELERVLSKPETFRVSTSKDDPGRSIHTKAGKFFALTKPGFCGACHDVTLLNGFRLEEAFAEYKQSPAAKRGETCQDCHMGKIQGVASGYDFGPAAVVGDAPTKDRKLTNHTFAGPDYSIIHPGLFPHNVEAAQFKTLAEWLQFDDKAGWGTDKFEDSVSKNFKFPKAWESIDDRYDAREIMVVQYERLEKARKLRNEVLRNGFKLSDISIKKSTKRGLHFSVDVSSGTDGHGVPTGFDAERLIFLEVTVKDSKGNTVFVSGDRDPNGDVRDAHSLYVHNGELKLDKNLFSLQSKFIVRALRGGEREQVLAVNTSTDVLPFVRPESRATTIYGRPRGARKHKQNLEPGASRTAVYKVSGRKIKRGERYSVTVKLISQMVPVNLIAAIQGAGFDYGMSPAQIAREVVAGSSILWTRKSTVAIR